MFATLPPDARLRIEGVCDRFEQALRAGRPGRVEDYLAGAAGPERTALLRELLALEAGYRHSAGDLSADAWRRRFPELGEEWLSGFFLGLFARPGAETVRPDDPTPVAAPRGASDHGRRFGEYDLLGVLGEGGMGVVFRARQRSADRLVALKMIRPGLGGADRGAMLDRFTAEARAAARLEHDNAVAVYDVGVVEGTPYYAMRLVHGRSLAAVVKAGPVAGAQAAAWMEPVARAVQHAHDRGLLHRDLKPANVLLDDSDRPFVSDFGLVKWAGAAPELTRTGEFLGTPSYVSPEQAADAARATAASDVYSLGATLYALLTGRPPFQAATVAETLHQVKYHDPVAPRALNPAIDRDLEVIALACLHKEPARRYASAGALADDLGRYRRGEPILARPVTRRQRAARWCRRNPVLAAAWALAVAALLATAGVSLAFGGYYRRANAELENINADLARANADLKGQRDRAGRLHGRSVVLAQTFTASLLSKRDGMRGQRLTDATLARTAVKLWKEILADDPKNGVARNELANTLYLQGAIARDARQPGLQRASWVEAVEVSEALVRDEPGSFDYAANLGLTCYNLGVLSNREQKPAEQGRWLQKAITTLKPLRARNSRDERVRWFLMSSHSGLGGIALDARDYAAALPQVEAALALAVPAEAGNLRLHGLAPALAGVGRHEEALRLVEAELARGRATREDQAAAAEVCALAAAAAPPGAKERYARRAVGLLKLARARGMYKTKSDVDELANSPSFAALRGRADFAAALAEE